MSLASDFAASQAAAAAGQVTANELEPPSFGGPNGKATVSVAGNLRLEPGAGNKFEIPPAAALAFAQWVIDTFGD